MQLLLIVFFGLYPNLKRRFFVNVTLNSDLRLTDWRLLVFILTLRMRAISLVSRFNFLFLSHSHARGITTASSLPSLAAFLTAQYSAIKEYSRPTSIQFVWLAFTGTSSLSVNLPSI